MLENENRSTSYIGDAEVKPPVPAVLRWILIAAAVLTDAGLFLGFFITDPEIIAFAAFLAVFGQIFIAAYVSYRAKRARCSKYVAGQVVGTIYKARTGNFPVISYTVNGKTYRIEGNVGRLDYKLGQEIYVYFNPVYPREATQKLPGGGLVFAIIGGIAWGFGSMGLFFLLAAL